MSAGQQQSERDGNLALIGFMAAGKTTIGRLLARRLGYAYVDTDDVVEAEADASIPRIFELEGEAGFRRRERAAVARVAAGSRTVIACGGGVIRDPDNVLALRARGRIVWLMVGQTVAAERILSSGRGRPMIDEHVPARTLDAVGARVAQLLAERTPFYRLAADQAVCVDGLSPSEIVERILTGVSDGGDEA